MAEVDLVRLYGYILERHQTWALAHRALEAIKNAIRSLELSPFSIRSASTIPSRELGIALILSLIHI